MKQCRIFSYNGYVSVFQLSWQKISPSFNRCHDQSMQVCINLLSPNIHIQILQTDLHTFPLRISWENLIKDHGIFSMMIILLILITLSLDSVWILLGENCCWSLLGLKGLIYLHLKWSLPILVYLLWFILNQSSIFSIHFVPVLLYPFPFYFIFST